MNSILAMDFFCLGSWINQADFPLYTKNVMRDFATKMKLQNKFNEKLIDEVTNLIERPHIFVGKFDKNFLKIPNEILITTMQRHQKYFQLHLDS